MAISVWFEDKTTGRVNNAIEARYFRSDEVVRRAVEFEHSPLAKSDYMRIVDPNGELSAEDCRRIEHAGGVVTGAFLPEIGRPSV
jgi:hypothetical protein